MLAVDFVEALRIGHELNQAAVGPRRQYLVRLHLQVAPLELEDLINLTHQLHRKLLLPNVIVGFHDHAKESP